MAASDAPRFWATWVARLRSDCEDLLVALVVRAQLEAVLARHLERDLEDVDRVEAQAVAVQRRRRHDVGRGDFEVQGFDQQHGQFVFEWRLLRSVAVGGKGGLGGR